MTHLIKKLQVTVLIIVFSVTALLGCQTLNKAPAPTITKAPKGTEPIADLPITNELLEQYHWQLVSAVSNTYDAKGELTRRPLGNFYHPDHPISASFESWSDNQYASFSSGCNGSRAPYFLLNDSTLKVGIIISTVIEIF